MAATAAIDHSASSRVIPIDRGLPLPHTIVDLRHLLAERFPPSFTPSVARLPTGLPAVDAITGGGFPKSAITELSSSQVSGGTAFLLQILLHNAHQHGYFLALVDGRDSFDPQPLGNRRLRNLLWIRCAKALEAIKASDLLLRDGNFPLVVLDLVLNRFAELRKIPQTSWYRLQRLVETAPTAFLILTRVSMISSAQLKLSLKNSWTLTDLEEDRNAARLQIVVTKTQGGRQRLIGGS